jgi:hypothetical protein
MIAYNTNYTYNISVLPFDTKMKREKELVFMRLALKDLQKFLCVKKNRESL